MKVERVDIEPAPPVIVVGVAWGIIDVTMPCGYHILWPAIKDVPVANTPCPCGDPTHWLVRHQ